LPEDFFELPARQFEQKVIAKRDLGGTVEHHGCKTHSAKDLAEALLAPASSQGICLGGLVDERQ
jgi:hypothetical protein